MAVKSILFLCTANSARSILAESIVNKLGPPVFQGFSAGSHPGGQVNPRATALLSRLGYPVAGARSKSWDEFAVPGAPPLDFVITVCDNAAGEVCPVWPGRPVTAHWGVPDPAAVTHDDAAADQAFHQAFLTLERRVRLFLALPLASLDRLALSARMAAIGQAGADDSL